ncbi:hypothetical protein [Halalkalibacter okhensis]|uniref:Uncharacterized protein n=1 Tax=Halalkalibacter okhensis TaxID=333138 RepID=A0A0B0IHD6_9BACI|nr:hypothetical protein [Halalkalibacter okhensis]KHF42008.1 hypothetical protein LQ50_01585 [Halalkalibacter okhensis]
MKKYYKFWDNIKLHKCNLFLGDFFKESPFVFEGDVSDKWHWIRERSSLSKKVKSDLFVFKVVFAFFGDFWICFLHMFVPLRSSHSLFAGRCQASSAVGSRPYLCIPQESSDFRSISLSGKLFIVTTLKKHLYLKNANIVALSPHDARQKEKSAPLGLKEGIALLSARSSSKKVKRDWSTFVASANIVALAPHDARQKEKSTPFGLKEGIALLSALSSAKR